MYFFKINFELLHNVLGSDSVTILLLGKFVFFSLGAFVNNTMIDITVGNVTFLIIYLSSKNYVWAGGDFSSTLLVLS